MPGTISPCAALLMTPAAWVTICLGAEAQAYVNYFTQLSRSEC